MPQFCMAVRVREAAGSTGAQAHGRTGARRTPTFLVPLALVGALPLPLSAADQALLKQITEPGPPTLGRGAMAAG